MYDVSIIGAGIVGCAIARELAKYNLKICLIEKNDDVGSGATKANSGIVHGGYAEKPGSIKAKFSSKGNSMYAKLNEELNFGFSQVGSFVIGFDEEDQAKIAELFAFGQKNGVPQLQIVTGDFVKHKEPNLNKDIKVALYCPTAGITSPYEFAIALAENAIQNGVELKLNREVTAIKKIQDYFLVTTPAENVQTKIVINAAGLYADAIAAMIGCDEFTISPRQGQYLLFDKDQGELINSVIFQVPTAVSKGILVTKTYHGNLMIGPDATQVTAKDYLDTDAKNIKAIIAAAKKSLPDFDLKKVITAFAGNRSAPSNGDFIIEESKVKGFINVAGIESPGLTAAPAIAAYVTEIIVAAGIVKLSQKAEFNPYRKPNNAKCGCIVCRCETVSEGEIRDALKGNIAINSLDAIKRRTRAGMGRCQGGFCTPKIMKIIHDELKIPQEKITKKGGESVLVFGKTK
jgi:glycerol-3-phosphate dehydrogenase